MNARPRVSIITPSYNQASFLAETLESIFAQAYPETECLVIDGGSTDGTIDVLRGFDNQLDYWVSEPDRGQSHAFNKGLEKATGGIIGWLNSDDLYLDNSIWRGVEYLAANPSIDIVFSDYIFIDPDSRFIKQRKEIPFSFQTYVWTADCYHANCAGFFRRRVFDTLGGLDETLHYGMDFEFYLRAAHAGFRVGHIHQYWGAYRLHPSSKSMRRLDVQKADAARVVSEYIPTETSPFIRIAKKRWWASSRIVRKFLLGSYLPRRTGPKHEL